MRRFFYDQKGKAVYYLTGAGVLLDSHNQALAWLPGPKDEEGVEPVLASSGQVIGWFDGQFLYDGKGYLVAFTKGAKVEGFDLPETQPLPFKAKPTRAAVHPFLVKAKKPSLKKKWSKRTFISPHGGRLA